LKQLLIKKKCSLVKVIFNFLTDIHKLLYWSRFHTCWERKTITIWGL